VRRRHGKDLCSAGCVGHGYVEMRKHRSRLQRDCRRGVIVIDVVEVLQHLNRWLLDGLQSVIVHGLVEVPLTDIDSESS